MNITEAQHKLMKELFGDEHTRIDVSPKKNPKNDYTWDDFDDWVNSLEGSENWN
jgi:hypothetical protein